MKCPTFLCPALALFALIQPASAQDEPEDSSLPQFSKAPITEFEAGMAYAVHSSSYDYFPQIQKLPDEANLRVVHRPKEVPKGEAPESPDEYGGFLGIETTGWNPPDPSLAVGPGHVVAVVNSTVAWWDKSDGTLQFSAPMGSQGNPGFFEPVGAGNFVFDPKCLYDVHSGRFFVLGLEVYSNTAYITFGLSDDSDPNGTWYKYRTNARTRINGNNYWVDYPGLGADDLAFYVTGNLFPLGGGGFGGIKFRAIDKSSILNGGTATWNDLRDGGGASAQAAYMRDPNGAAYFAHMGNTTVEFQAITDPTGSPTLFSTSVNVGGWSSPPSAPNSGGGSVDTLDGRVMNVYQRGQRVQLAHAVASGGRSVCRWYELRHGDWPNSGNVTVKHDGDVDLGSGLYSFFPAIAKAAGGRIAMVLARSSSSEFLSVWSAWRDTDDPDDTMPNVRKVKNGDSSYGGGRYGDYFDVAVDPVNDITLWGIGEYPASDGSWSTWIGTLGNNPFTVNYIEPGSPGTGGVIPFLRVRDGRIGSTMKVRVKDTPPGTLVYLAVGGSSGNFTLKGANVYVNFPWLLIGPIPADANGELNLDIPLELDASLVGPTLYMQGLFLDAGAPLGLATSRAAEFAIGDD